MDNRNAVVAETPIYCKNENKNARSCSNGTYSKWEPSSNYTMSPSALPEARRPGDLNNQICLFIYTKEKTSSTGMQ